MTNKNWLSLLDTKTLTTHRNHVWGGSGVDGGGSRWWLWGFQQQQLQLQLQQHRLSSSSFLLSSIKNNSSSNNENKSIISMMVTTSSSASPLVNGHFLACHGGWGWGLQQHQQPTFQERRLYSTTIPTTQQQEPSTMLPPTYRIYGEHVCLSIRALLPDFKVIGNYGRMVVQQPGRIILEFFPRHPITGKYQYPTYSNNNYNNSGMVGGSGEVDPVIKFALRAEEVGRILALTEQHQDHQHQQEQRQEHGGRTKDDGNNSQNKNSNDEKVSNHEKKEEEEPTDEDSPVSETTTTTKTLAEFTRLPGGFFDTPTHNNTNDVPYKVLRVQNRTTTVSATSTTSLSTNFRLILDYEMNGQGGQLPVESSSSPHNYFERIPGNDEEVEDTTTTPGPGPLSIDIMVGEWYTIHQILQYSIPRLTGWSTSLDSAIQNKMNYQKQQQIQQQQLQQQQGAEYGSGTSNSRGGGGNNNNYGDVPF